MRLQRDAAAAAIRERIARAARADRRAGGGGHPPGRRLADGRRAVARSRSGAATIRETLSLYAYGGAGPMHCASFGAELGVESIVIPATAMVHCAYGALSSDVIFSAQAALAAGSVALDGAAPARCARRRTARACVHGAGARCRRGRLRGRRRRRLDHAAAQRRPALPAPDQRADRRVSGLVGRARGSIRADLRGLLRQGRGLSGGRDRDHDGAGAGDRRDGQAATGGDRWRTDDATDGDRGPPATAVAPAQQRELIDPATAAPTRACIRRWEALVVGERIQGPAVIEHPTTTVYVAPGQHAALDRLGNLRLAIVGAR